MMSANLLAAPTIMNWQSSNVAGQTKKTAVGISCPFLLLQTLIISLDFLDNFLYDDGFHCWKYSEYIHRLVVLLEEPTFCQVGPLLFNAHDKPYYHRGTFYHPSLSV